MRTFFFNDAATTEIYALSLHDALPISRRGPAGPDPGPLPLPASRQDRAGGGPPGLSPRLARPIAQRSEEHTSELQSRQYLVCRLLLEKKINLTILQLPTLLPPACSLTF